MLTCIRVRNNVENYNGNDYYLAKNDIHFGAPTMNICEQTVASSQRLPQF